ncbi:MAG: hypothetical protein JO110_25015, partial [Acetobacteraceae bacterium]|nr:hypothetical protein [Acetobacteraceae bacterium]
KGALTWKNTSDKDTSGHVVRRANLYTLIMDFTGTIATVVRTMRTLWRERGKVVTVSKPNQCHGLPPNVSSTELRAAQNRLAKVAKERTALLQAQWTAHHST